MGAIGSFAEPRLIVGIKDLVNEKNERTRVYYTARGIKGRENGQLLFEALIEYLVADCWECVEKLASEEFDEIAQEHGFKVLAKEIEWDVPKARVLFGYVEIFKNDSLMKGLEEGFNWLKTDLDALFISLI
ncbi:hypothetical protein [Thermococcus barophilus]|uniref:Uncharacterized protein n=1 Tax=Thermococcus barophilus (strain DSM 11836 / MP) TaxID=391623 RepID=F0LN78_THEBM|nr:hypothetical protein [Thermococcus barophilus]ADT85217.1 hypothetical protein TERMP_02244 [Thermococcus barophilus MP]